MTKNIQTGVIVLGLLGLSSLSACKNNGSDRDSAGLSAEEILPNKKPISPNGETFDLSEDSTLSPNDPSNQSGLLNAIRAPQAWFINSSCSGFRIAIVDTGVDRNHEDLSDNLSSTAKNFITGESGLSAVQDDHGHGTHVAGIISAKGDNSTGISGICWEADLVIAKALDEDGSATTSDIIEAMEWAVTRENVKVVNASFGITMEATTVAENEYFEDLFSGVTALAESRKVLIVAAAGNEGVDVNVNRVYPAALSSKQIIAVAANLEGYQSKEGIFANSNYGGNTIHLSAPGYQIMSTVLDDSYGRKTGTSMAAPMVTGALALAWSHIGKNNISSQQIMKLLLNNVEKHSRTKSKTPGVYLLTGGKLDLGSLLKAADNFKNDD